MTMNKAALSSQPDSGLAAKTAHIGPEGHNAATHKQLPSQKHSQQKQQNRLAAGGTLPKQGSLPLNAASKSNLAISSFMPQNVLPLPANAPKTQQMLETSVSQTS